VREIVAVADKLSSTLTGRRKCPVCKEWFKLEEEGTFEKNGRFYHRACYEKSVTEAERDLASLENYIKQLFGIDVLTVKIKNQIQAYIKSGYKVRGIEKTLRYWFEIKKEPIEKANGGIAIVGYVYEDARNFYSNQEANKKAILQNTDLQNQPKEIYIKLPQRKCRPSIDIKDL